MKLYPSNSYTGISVYKRWNDDHTINVSHSRSNKSILILEKSDQVTQERINEFDGNKLISGEKVYFCKSSLTPRNKIKIYCEDNNIILNKTNRMELAKSIVFNREDLIELLKDKKDDLLIFEDKNSLKEMPNVNFDQYMKDDLLKQDNKHVIPSHLYDELTPIFLKAKQIKGVRSPDIKTEAFYSTFIYAWNNPNIRIIYDQSIIQDMNVQMIDPETYMGLRQILGSNTVGNNTIGTEILTNCNPEENRVALVLLFSEYWNNIKGLKQKIKGLNNIIEYFNEYSGFWNSQVNLELLYKQKPVLNENETKILELFLQEKLKQYWKIPYNVNVTINK